MVTPVLESPTEITASARSARSLTRNSRPFNFGDFAFLRSPEFFAHRIVNYTDDDFALETQRNRNAKMRNAVEIIHGAVERIDHPLILALLIANDSFFAIKRVSRKVFRSEWSINSCVRTSISSLMSCASADVDTKRLMKMLPEQIAGGARGFDRRVEVMRHDAEE